MQKESETIKALRLFYEPGSVFEVRVLDAECPGYHRPHIESGYFEFEHIEELEKALKKITAARGVYITPNAVNPVLLARAANRLRPAGKEPTTSDADITRRRWLLIDCDAIRPPGISSTDEEHEAALYKAIEVSDGLKSMGWPEPVFIDSGNGAQLMYKIDLPADDGKLVQNCLQALESVSDSKVDIDQAVYNPSRIWRLPGTMNCKGDNIPSRPHRMAKIIDAPERIEIVPEAKLKELAGTIHKVENKSSSSVDISGIAGEVLPPLEQFNIDDWIRKNCSDIQGPFPWNGGRKWIFPVCPFNDAHTNKSAVITEQPSGAIGFKCHHNGCKNYDWQALRKLKEPFMENRPQIKMVSVLEKDEEKESEKPWRKISNDDVKRVIERTFIGKMSELFSKVTVQPLPLEATLLKSIVLAGCALSEKDDAPKTSLAQYLNRGSRAARLCIDTAGGQVANAYAMLVANSASGKDIGNLLDIMARQFNWSIATGGSAEGIADSLVKTNNGLISISELADWLDQKHWQHKATGFLTDAFNKGFFEFALSKRGRYEERVVNYCYPNIIANIQPEVFEETVSRIDASKGFLARFLYCKMPEFYGDPAKFDIEMIITRMTACIEAFRLKRGIVDVHEGYLSELSKMFRKESPPSLHSCWRRLVNEYGPRFAVMLSVSDKNSSDEKVILDDNCWEGAAILTQWFFGHAERMLSGIEDGSPFSKQREKLFKRVFKVIQRFNKDGARRKDISNYASYGSTAKERQEALIELIERGIIEQKKNRYFVLNIPPGWE